MVATGAEPGDIVAVNRREVVTLCLAALGAGRRVAELLTEAARFAEDRPSSGWLTCSTSSEPRS